MNEGQHLMIHRNTRNFEMLNKDEIVLPASEYKKPARQIREIDEAKKLTMSYEYKQFTEEQIKKVNFLVKEKSLTIKGAKTRMKDKPQETTDTHDVVERLKKIREELVAILGELDATPPCGQPL